ncbi:hypothetical protein R5R35_010421 [Gryllus longicercus]|uniref:Uncharacterized protein n=1 Tax=Gryllus longicercus TaxID=2509291 RepID=A0AAN9VPN3_9ORTH
MSRSWESPKELKRQTSDVTGYLRTALEVMEPAFLNLKCFQFTQEVDAQRVDWLCVKQIELSARSNSKVKRRNESVDIRPKYKCAKLPTVLPFPGCGVLSGK